MKLISGNEIVLGNIQIWMNIRQTLLVSAPEMTQSGVTPVSTGCNFPACEVVYSIFIAFRSSIIHYAVKSSL